MTILRKTVRDSLFGILGWGIGMALLGFYVVWIWPEMGDQFAEYFADLPEAFTALIGDADYTTFEGFINGEMMSWSPIMIGVYGILLGSRLLVGEEEAGTMDILLAQPVRRSSIVLQKAAGMFVIIALIHAISFVGLWLGMDYIEYAGDVVPFAQAFVLSALLVSVFGALALWLSTWVPSRAVAAATAGLLLIASHFVETLGGIKDSIDPLRPWVPHHYFRTNDVIAGDLDPRHVWLLLLLSVIFTVSAVAVYDGRDVTLGAGGGRLSLPAKLARIARRMPAA